MSVSQKVIEILAIQARLEPAEVTPEMSIEQLGLDSLAKVEAIFAIEEAFDITIPIAGDGTDEQAFDMSSVASIIKSTEQLIATSRP